MTMESISKRTQSRRRYQLADGTKVPGVTTVTGLLAKPGLVRWANRLGLEGIDAQRYTDESAQAGTLAHALIQARLQETPLERGEWSAEQLEAAERSLARFEDWRRAHTLRVLQCESSYVSEDKRYGGTVDCYCLLDGRPTLLDFKTGKAVYEEGFVQLAAYARLLEETGLPVEDCRILRVGRDGAEGFEERGLAERERWYALFEHLLGVYWLKKELGWR